MSAQRFNTVDELKNAITELKYKWFDNNKPFNLNIIGVRTSDELTNKFTDELYLAYRNEKLEMQFYCFPITTKSGITYLVNPLNPNKGTAILVPGQYLGVFQIGLHQGKYEALVQRGFLKLYRDNDKDTTFDLDSTTIENCDNCGVNIHHAGADSIYINDWSAACQVFKRKKDFLFFMKIVKTSAKLFSNKFTYTLIK